MPMNTCPSHRGPGSGDSGAARGQGPASRSLNTDLIIAATAQLAGLTVLHLDKDFDLIAQITDQPIERLNVSSAAITDNGQRRYQA